jgi:hypothetical protein
VADGEEGVEESIAICWLDMDVGVRQSEGGECVVKRARAFEERQRDMKWVGDSGESRRRQE